MFGQKDDKAYQDENAGQDQPQDMVVPDDHQPAAQDDWQHPGAPLDDAGNAPLPTPSALPSDDTNADPLADESSAPSLPSAAPAPAASAPTDTPHDLIDIKQQALGQLSPLLSHLDQTPEEKFRTTMMMIQASDDQSLLQPAYEAAQKIEDEKVRAQALLDIINEINYFTQQHKG